MSLKHCTPLTLKPLEKTMHQKPSKIGRMPVQLRHFYESRTSKWKISYSCGVLPSSGVNVIVSRPALSTIMSVARYWSPYACLSVLAAETAVTCRCLWAHIAMAIQIAASLMP